MKIHWNLDPPRSVLAELIQPGFIAKIQSQVSSLEDLSSRYGSKHEYSYTNSSVLKAINLVDSQLDSIHTLSTLFQLAEKKISLPVEIHQLTSRFINCIGIIRDNLSKNPELLKGPIRKWYKSLPAQGPDQTIVNSYQSIARDYINGQGPAELLFRRNRIDPDRLALSNQLHEQRLLTSPAFTAQHQYESQSYWASLLDRSGLNVASIDQARRRESQRYEITSWSLEQAMEVLFDALYEIHPVACFEIPALFKEGRVHITDIDHDSDLCLDTPLGSYIRAFFDGGIECLLRLAHETGHAIQQAAFRQSQGTLTPLSSLDSEVWAIRAERLLLDYLEQQRDVEVAARSLRKSRRIELDHRHRMLHSFENDLHEPSLDTREKLVELWLSKNKSFYGERICLENDFNNSWADIHHLYTAPFYLMIYPFAYKKETDSIVLPGL